MDFNRDFDTKEQTIEHGLNEPHLHHHQSVNRKHDYLYNKLTNKTQFCLERNEEGLYYWEIY